MTIPRAMYNAATSAVTIRHQASGPAFAVVSACTSGAHSIGLATQWIRTGVADAALAGAADAPVTFGTIRGWEALRVMSVENDAPASACRPFSADRNGFVLGEGAAVLALEELDSARRRGAPILGEILGVGLSSDARHATDPSVDGAARAIEMAIRDAGLTPEEIGYINAHGTATRANDPVETEAVRRVFGAVADRVPVSSTKSAHGHAMGATGAIEVAASLLALREGFVPATLNYRKPDPACDLDYVPNEPRQTRARVFLSNSFGFGGLNGVLVVKAVLSSEC